MTRRTPYRPVDAARGVVRAVIVLELAALAALWVIR
jgi:hypothetical protein